MIRIDAFVSIESSMADMNTLKYFSFLNAFMELYSDVEYKQYQFCNGPN